MFARREYKIACPACGREVTGPILGLDQARAAAQWHLEYRCRGDRARIIDVRTGRGRTIIRNGG